ncbi:SPOSA6832_01604 [Sporobolomyces salmonicolor]|uniref:SPOSA6832_01604-mRNA-1:cds n=1 Tax=Sporidiobolus salmonicolor TaxID=5005 RepID=A0A0D6EJ64_SPOSA|nr:SPOSA6832_01604 [Sporobolomyces salmonicolor]
MGDLAIEVNNLEFAYPQLNAAPRPVLDHVDLNLPRGSRCILVGANGAGKSTLLQILAGKRLTRSGAKVLGEDVFFNTPKAVTYLGTEWATNPVVRSDLVVSDFLYALVSRSFFNTAATEDLSRVSSRDSVGGYRHKERRDRLLDILDVDLNWHMHEVSDGERRRVQIVTVDLDVLVRSRLLSFLIAETATRNATILYATHIFDGLDTFPTHLCHVQLGSTVAPSPLAWPLPADFAGVPRDVRAKMDDPQRGGSRLLELAIHWLEVDRARRIEQEIRIGGQQKRGALAGGETTDSEKFYRQYDYSH